MHALIPATGWSWC